jgi:hypothetical protein
MNVAEALLEKNLIPVLNHQNDTYQLIEIEGQRAATGLLHKPSADVHVAITHSLQANAYAFRHGSMFVITLTDSLLRRLEEAITSFLDAPPIREYISRALGIEYESSAPWPTAMTWGAQSSSRRADITNDTRIALFYEIFDNAWFFAVLHEAAHIGNGDVDATRKRPDDLHLMIGETADILSYGGDGPNRHARYIEFDADRSAACWLMQIILRKYVKTPKQQDPYALAHTVLSAFGGMAAILQIAHHEPDPPEEMGKIDHPSFEIRLVGFWEGSELVLTDLAGSLELQSGYQILHAITLLRRAMEFVVLGAPSKYMISL